MATSESNQDKKPSDQENAGGCPISDVQWSATRPMMLGVASGNALKIFDLLQGESPVITIEHDAPVTRVAFNKSG